MAAVDRLADLFAVTYVGWWEWAARRDPILAQLDLSPDQCGALVALLAGSRPYRHNGKPRRTAIATGPPTRATPCAAPQATSASAVSYANSPSGPRVPLVPRIGPSCPADPPVVSAKRWADHIVQRGRCLIPARTRMQEGAGYAVSDERPRREDEGGGRE